MYPLPCTPWWWFVSSVSFFVGGREGGGGGAHFSDRKFVTVIFDKFSKYCNLAKFNFTINVTEIILWRTMTSTKK